MSGKVFVDTNILLYAHDQTEPAKRAIALARYRELLTSDRLALSTQVLGEFYVNAVRPRTKGKAKLAPVTTRDEAARIIALLAQVDCYSVTPADCVRATSVARTHNVGYWDALIIVAASAVGAETLLSEDLNHGQTIEGVTVENPFRALATRS